MPARIRHCLSAALALGACLWSAVPRAAEEAAPEVPAFAPTVNDWGEHGLIQVPSARFGADGEFNFTFSHVHPYDRYNIYMTPLPWAEAAFRYTDVNNKPYGPASFSGSQTYKDRSFDLRLGLSDESEYWPRIAVGIRDIAGTGLFSSEYLVANRRYYNFDFTLGLGWGLMSSNLSLPNPFGFLAKSLKTRPTALGTASSGAFTFDYFHGPKMGLFGGVEYQTPIESVRLKLELDPDNYRNEPLNNSFRARSPINAAIVSTPYPFLELSAGFERGTTLMLRITFKANFNSPGLYLDQTKPPALVPRPNPEPPLGRPLALSSIPRVATVANEIPPRALSATPSGSRRAASAQAPVEPRDAAPTPADAGAAIDRLFTGAHALGFDVADVAINGDVATITVGTPPSSPGARAALADLAVVTLPGVTRAEIATSPSERAASAPFAAQPPKPVEQAVAQKIFADLRAIGFTGISFALDGPHAHLAFAQPKYRLIPVAIGRAARIVAADSPPEVELITLNILDNGVTLASVTLQRRDLERAVVGAGSPEEVWANTTIAGADPSMPRGIVNPDAWPNGTWSLNPAMRQQLGGPDNFIIYELYAALNGSLHPLPGLSVDGTLGANLLNNLNELQPHETSSLPHVRSDIAKYFKEGKTGIFRAQTNYIFNVMPNVYGRFSAGILEQMFSGVDAEVLYRPLNQRFAIGFDINHVAQRRYDDLLGLLPYQVTTGHLSFYYKLPFYQIQTAIHVGRYLAGDKGATFEISREFAGGIRAGIFFTRTNISAAQFGEGSFDKGFTLSIPLDLLLGDPTRNVAVYDYRPLTRDGGQMLDIERPLYNETDGYDPARLSRMWPHLLE